MKGKIEKLNEHQGKMKISEYKYDGHKCKGKTTNGKKRNGKM